MPVQKQGFVIGNVASTENPAGKYFKPFSEGCQKYRYFFIAVYPIFPICLFCNLSFLITIPYTHLFTEWLIFHHPSSFSSFVSKLSFYLPFQEHYRWNRKWENIYTLFLHTLRKYVNFWLPRKTNGNYYKHMIMKEKVLEG